MDKLIYGILEQNVIERNYKKLLHEEFLDAEHLPTPSLYASILVKLLATGFILSLVFIRSYKARKKLKESCKHFKDPKQLKTCMIRGAINSLKTERKELAGNVSKCMKTKNPEKCKKILTQFVKDYDIKIREKELELKSIK